jgi:hypothetical protein
VASPTATPPRLPMGSVRPGMSTQRIAPPGPVHGLTSKRQPLPRVPTMAPSNLFYDTPPGSVAMDSIQPAAVTGDVIDAQTITASNIAAGTITGNEIAANTITGAHIVAGSVDAGTIIATGSITTPMLAAGAVTADKISVSQLSAITANMGTLTAGVIQGGVFQTGAGSPRVVIDSSGMTMTDPTGMVTFQALSATGVLTLGNPAGSRFTFDPALLSGQRLYLEGQLVGTGTIMGPSFTTSLSNPRVVMDSSGIRAYPASSFPTTGVLDSFDRPDTGPPPSDLWDVTGLSGNFHDLRYSDAPGLAIRSNAAKALTDVETSMRWSGVLSSDDNEAYCTVNVVSQQVELWCRHDINGGAPTAYVLWWDGVRARIQSYGAASWTDVTPGVTIPGGAVNGMQLGIRALGSAITTWYRKSGGAWTQLESVNDNRFVTGRQIGVLVYKLAQIIDDFGGGAYLSGFAGASFTLDSQTGTVSMVGGTLTAAQIQTATSNPRIVFNASGLTSLLADGSVPWKVDAASGAVTAARISVSGYLAGAGRITFDQKAMPPGTATFMSLNRNQQGGGAELWNTGSNEQGDITSWAKQSWATQAAGVVGTPPYGRIGLTTAQAQLLHQNTASEQSYCTLQASYALFGANRADATTGRVFISSVGIEVFSDVQNSVGLYIDKRSSSLSYITINAAGGASRFRIQRGTSAAPGAPVDYYDGAWIMGQVSGQRDIVNTDASFYCTFGARFWATAASQSMGAFQQYRQVRGNNVNGAVNPGSFTVSSAFSYGNVASAAIINVIRAEGAQISFSSGAAGASWYYCTAVAA